MPTPSFPSTSLSPSTKPPSKLNVHAKEFVPQFQNLSIIRKADWQQQQEATHAPPPPPSSLPLSQSPVLVASSSSSPAPSSPPPSTNPPQTEGQSSPVVAASPLSDALTPITTTQDTNDPPVSCSSGYISERGDDYQKTYSPTQQEGRDAGSPVSERDLVESPTFSREPADASSLSGESSGFIAPSSECEESEETRSNQVTSKDSSSSRQSQEASSTRRSSVTHETVSCPSLPTRSWAAVVGKQSSSSSSVSLTAISSGTRETTPPLSTRSVAEPACQKNERKESELNSGVPTASSRLKQLGGKIVLVFHPIFLSLITEQLASASVSHQPVSLTPRGLINSGHLCYVHAVSVWLSCSIMCFHYLLAIASSHQLSFILQLIALLEDSRQHCLFIHCCH